MVSLVLGQLIPWICWLGSIRAAMHREADRGGFTASDACTSQFLPLQASLVSPGGAATSHPTEVKFLARQDKQYSVGVCSYILSCAGHYQAHSSLLTGYGPQRWIQFLLEQSVARKI